MRSLLSVIKQNRISDSDEVVMIPDAKAPETPKQENQEVENANQPALKEMHGQIVDKAKKEAEHVAQSVLKVAHKQHDDILKQANDEAEQIREAAYQEGLQKGRLEKQEDIEKSIEKTNHAIHQLKMENIQYMHLYEEELKNLAVDIASRILAKQVNPEGYELGEMAKTAINSVKDAQWITVEISQRMPGLLSYLQEELKNCQADIEVAAKDLPEDACILKTSDGNIDASVSTQLRNVREYFHQV